MTIPAKQAATTGALPCRPPGLARRADSPCTLASVAKADRSSGASTWSSLTVVLTASHDAPDGGVLRRHP